MFSVCFERQADSVFQVKSHKRKAQFDDEEEVEDEEDEEEGEEEDEEEEEVVEVRRRRDGRFLMRAFQIVTISNISQALDF